MLLVLSFVQSFAIFQGKYYDHGDSGLVNLLYVKTVQNTISSYNNAFYGGQEAVIVTPPLGLAFAWINVYFIAYLNPMLGSEIFWGLCYFIAALGMFFLIERLLKDSERKDILAFISALLFTFYFYPQYGPTHVIPNMLLPWCILGIMAMHDELTSFNIFGTSLAVGLFLSLNTSASLPGLILIGLFMIGDVLAAKDKLMHIVAHGLVILATIAMNFNFVWQLISYMAHAPFIDGSTNNKLSISILLGYNVQTILSMFHLVSYQQQAWAYQNTHNALLPAIAESLLFEGMLCGFAYLASKKNHAWFYGATLVSLAIFIFLYTNLAMPFGIIWAFLATQFQLFLVYFRAADPIMYYIVFFLEAFLLPFGLEYLFKSKWRPLQFLALLILAALLVHLSYFDIYPTLMSNATFAIPGYALQASTYINYMPGSFNVATLPAEYPFGHYATYYYGTDIYAYLIQNPVWTGGYVAPSGQIGPNSVQKAYYDAVFPIQTRPMGADYICNVFQKYGIRYILVQNDTAINGTSEGYLRYNLSVLYQNLKAAFPEAASFENTVIFEATSCLTPGRSE